MCRARPSRTPWSRSCAPLIRRSATQPSVCKMKRTPRPREHARLISTDGGAGLPLAGLGIGWGARGADHYGLHAVVAAGSAACVRSLVFLTGRCRRGPPRSRLSWRWVAAWCRARGRGGSLSSRGRGGSRGPRRAWSPSSGAVAGVGVHGAGGGPDGEVGWCWRVAAPRCLRSRMGRWQRMCMA